MNVGDTVYYNDTGPEDTGEIVECNPVDEVYLVSWATNEQLDWFTEGQLTLVN